MFGKEVSAVGRAQAGAHPALWFVEYCCLRFARKRTGQWSAEGVISRRRYPLTRQTERVRPSRSGDGDVGVASTVERLWEVVARSASGGSRRRCLRARERASFGSTVIRWNSVITATQRSALTAARPPVKPTPAHTPSLCLERRPSERTTCESATTSDMHEKNVGGKKRSCVLFPRFCFQSLVFISAGAEEDGGENDGAVYSTNLRRGRALPKIYKDYWARIEAADAQQDLRWWANAHGTGMPMNWPVFEEYSPEMRRIANPKKASLDGQAVVLTKQRITDHHHNPQVSSTAPITNGNGQPQKSERPSDNGAKTPDGDGYSPFDDDWDAGNDALVDDGRPGVKVKALYDYAPQESDELQLCKGEIFEKLEDEDDQGWCKGRVGNKTTDDDDMRRLCLLMLATTLFAAVKGQGGVRIRHLHIISEIQSRFAITDVLSEMENENSQAQEVTFAAQLPEEAFITNFSLEQNGVITYGTVKEKDEARKEYEKAKNEGKTASEVRKNPRATNVFEISINLAAHSKINFNLTYQEVLRRVHGVYKHIINVHPNQPVDDVQVDVLIAERDPISLIHVPAFGEDTAKLSNKELLNVPEATDVEARSTNEKTGSLAYVHFKPEMSAQKRVNGQLVVLYDVERGKDGGQIEVVNGYFVHYVAPADIRKGDKHVVFVLDKSGSMKGRKFEQMKTAMKTILSEMDETDRVNILMFSDKVEQWTQGSVPANAQNVEEAKRFIDSTEVSGGTNIFAALVKAIELLDADRSDPLATMIVFLTDGQPTIGEKNANVIVDQLTRKNGAASEFSLHSIAFGDDADYALLKRISGRNKGLARKVYEDSDASLQISGFYEEIAVPLLRNVKIEYISENIDVGSLVEDGGDSLFGGGEMVRVGKIKPDHNQDVRATVSGLTKNGPVQFDAVSDSDSPTSRCFPKPPPKKTAGEDKFGSIPRKAIVLCDEEIIDGGTEGEGDGDGEGQEEGQGEEDGDGEREGEGEGEGEGRGREGSDWSEESHVPGQPRAPLVANSVGGFLERMWAYRSIKKYTNVKDVQAEGPQEVANVVTQISKLALKYGFVTDYTSMVVILPNESEARELSQTTETREVKVKQEELNPLEGRPAGFNRVPQSSVLVPEPPKESPHPLQPTGFGSTCTVDVVIILDLVSNDVANFYRSRRFAERVVAVAGQRGQITARYVIARLEQDRSLSVVHNLGDRQSIEVVQGIIADILTANPVGQVKDVLTVLRGSESPKLPKLVLFFTSGNGDLGRFLPYLRVIGRTSAKTVAVSPYENFTIDKRGELLRVLSSERQILGDPSVEQVAEIIAC
uniref:Uncharacterized protein n=1 Tax=Plectus sambesii TaxID=2011161 RepID=A0A914W5Z2_9BILA